ncbi:odorant receptor 131-2-like [Chanos chanos]|uniref:Odorant receptor 131-2-like n=1 Tax=Chanos chanos TaxID=29144 RepID=A0A6J2W4B9_CHACN|nr:odorant receptor 131-2-like [Chanos chanos]
MTANNKTTSEVLFIHQQIFHVLDAPMLTKFAIALLVALFFVYVNGVLLFVLWSKPVFKETPRYILFAHMLLNDSIQLLISLILYICSLAFLQLAKVVCFLLVFVATSTFSNAPLNLVVMSLERYAAICFPLRHSEIATRRRTCVAIGVIRIIGSINFMIDTLFAVVTEPKSFHLLMFCTRERTFIAPWQADMYLAFNVFYFVSVTVIIVFTYISIIVAARSVSTNKESTKKAHRTVLLHLIQLGLCLTSFLYGTIERILAMTSNSKLFSDLRYLNFLIVLLLPRCLSPLIYGLRDDAVRNLFRHYFCCRSAEIKPVRINPTFTLGGARASKLALLGLPTLSNAVDALT